jgi:hypothetical protein
MESIPLLAHNCGRTVALQSGGNALAMTPAASSNAEVHVKRAKATIITIAAIASLAGCAAPVSSSEDTGLTEQASTTGGVSATISTRQWTGNFMSTVVVTNNSNGPASNWQVGISMPSTATVSNANQSEVANIGGVWTFNPGSSGTVLAAGASTQFQFSGTYTGTYVAPTIVTVDGESNGAAGVSPDGIDHIARTAASGALGVAFAYENNKLPNTGDPLYSAYDTLIWTAQSYIISNGQIAFDPNVPGYKFIPQQAMAALATIQQDPSVAEYLVSGLQSCFADTSGQFTYTFNAATLRGFPTTTSGSVAGVPIPPNGPNPAQPYKPVDTYTIASAAAAAGAEAITITEKSTTDYWFGMLTSGQMGTFSNTSAVIAKYTGANQTMCSPFNGPGGGTSNPYLVITLNGSSISARQQQVGAQCPNGCTSTIVLDPIAYTIPGPQYDSHNNLLGPQNNPFALDPTDVYSDPTHYMQFSTNPAASYGTFSRTMTLFGQSVEKWLICGSSGAGC